MTIPSENPLIPIVAGVQSLSRTRRNSMLQGRVKNNLTTHAPLTVDVEVFPRWSLTSFLVRDAIVLAPPDLDTALSVGTAVMVFVPTGRPSDEAYVIPTYARPNVLNSNYGSTVSSTPLTVDRPLPPSRSTSFSARIEVNPTVSYDFVRLADVAIQVDSATAHGRAPILDIYAQDEAQGSPIATLQGRRVNEEVVYTALTPLRLPVPSATTTYYLVPGFRGFLATGNYDFRAASSADSNETNASAVVTLGGETRSGPPWGDTGLIPLIRLFGQLE